MSKKKETSEEIIDILNENKVGDLKRFLMKRERLNNCNIYLMYLFHFMQTAGLIATSVGTSYNLSYLIWSGISLNALSSLVIILEKTNVSISKKLFKNIEAIKNGEYIDEDLILEEQGENNQTK